jgi:hypothetical protein
MRLSALQLGEIAENLCSAHAAVYRTLKAE